MPDAEVPDSNRPRPGPTPAPDARTRFHAVRADARFRGLGRAEEIARRAQPARGDRVGRRARRAHRAQPVRLPAELRRSSSAPPCSTAVTSCRARCATADIRITLVPLLAAVGGRCSVAAWLRGHERAGRRGAGHARRGPRLAGGRRRSTATLRDATASAFVLLYLPTLAAFAVLLVHPDDGAARVIAFVATVVCSDTGGYATGVLFGRAPAGAGRVQGQDLGGLRRLGGRLLDDRRPAADAHLPRGLVEGPAVRPGDRGHRDDRATSASR